jgi:hypothetical protein
MTVSVSDLSTDLEREARLALQRHARDEEDVRWMRPILDALDELARLKDEK